MMGFPENMEEEKYHCTFNSSSSNFSEVFIIFKLKDFITYTVVVGFGRGGVTSFLMFFCEISINVMYAKKSENPIVYCKSNQY